MSNKVLILHTGGTLGMRPREPDRALEPDEFGSTVLEHVPELRQLAEIETRVLHNLDSTDLRPEHWGELAHAIVEAAAGYDGIVVTHGTDAMAYTASALSFQLRNLDRPVILTGSQRPLADVRSDGRANLIGAVDLALQDIPEVAIYFDGLLLRGNRASKHNSFAFGAFTSSNSQPLAEVGLDIKHVLEPLRPQGPLRLEGDFDPRVCVCWVTPGQDGAWLRLVKETDAKALLLIAPGVGNLPVRDRVLADAVAELTAAGVVVAVGSQARSGSVDLHRYVGGRLARDSGAVGIGDMTIEAATVKLMYLLGTLDSAEEVRNALATPIAGEIAIVPGGRGGDRD